jgi:cell division protein FtsL
MTDWADGIEMRNYGIKCVIDRRMLSELVRIITSLAMIAGALLFYSWVRSHLVNTGYEGQKLYMVEESLLRVQKRLILEEETLRDPQRIDIIARNDLGMMPVRPNQLIVSQSQNTAQGSSDTMAMANSEAADLKKTAGGKRFGNFSN